MEVNLDDYILGGYLLVKDGNRQTWLEPLPLLPNKLISLSTCISQHFETLWGWSIEKNQTEISEFGIPSEKLTFLEEWSNNNENDPYGVSYRLNDARAFAHEVFAASDNIPYIIGMGFLKQLAAKFIEDNQNSDYPGAVFELLSKPQPMPSGGQTLGFEVVSYSFGGIGHSWLCSLIHQQFDIKLNAYGLMDAYADALRVYEWISDDNQQGHRAEPEPYYPWLLLRYPSQA